MWNLVHAELDRRSAPVTVFFRDDDAGWNDARLVSLLDTFERAHAPLDLAVIPCAVHDVLAGELLARAAGGPLGLHQHGYQHINHEIRGRKCEFGPGRAREKQAADIAAGWDLLTDAFDGALDPIFTPPWNRCTRDTAEVLAVLGFQLLSRDRGAEPVGDAIAQLPVDVDWCKQVDGARATPAHLDAAIAAALRSHDTVGIMLHHAVMDLLDAGLLDTLLPLLTRHAAVDCRLMRDCVALETFA